MVALRSVLHEVFPLDIELFRELHLSLAVTLILGIVDRVEQVGLSVFRIVVDDQFDRVEDAHDSRRHLVEMLASRLFEPHHLNSTVELCDPDPLAECADGLRSVAASTQTADRRHPRIVPASHEVAFDQFEEFPLAHHHVVEVQPSELVLVRSVNAKLLDEPVVEDAVRFEFERAD